MKSRMLKVVCLSAVAVVVVGLAWGRMFASDGHRGRCGNDGRMAAAGKKEAHAGYKSRAAALKQALEAIEAARQAVQANDKAKALAALTRAKDIVTTSHQAMVRAGGIVNARCPVMGSKLDPAKVPAKLTRIYKDKNVGFCCKSCPNTWDKMSAESKEQKLRQSGAATTTSKAAGHGKGHDESKAPRSFTCSMHPQIKLSKPGNCPLCNMKLIPTPHH